MEDEILASDVKKGYTVNLESAKRSSKQNAEGISFVGYEVKIDLISKKDTLTLEGWMIEGEFMQFLRNHKKQIDTQSIVW